MPKNSKMIVNNTYSNEISSYWNLIKDVKDDIKIKLITLLSESLSRSSERRSIVVSDSTADFVRNVYGAWQSPQSAEEFINTINEGKSCKDPVSFD